MRTSSRYVVAVALGVATLGSACGSDSATEPVPETDTETNTETDTETGAGTAPDASEPASGGVELVPVEDAASTIADPPPDLVILDVRTPEEYAAGHIDGATMLDFYEPDFADRVAELDRDVPYVIYCRSGNRSGQTAVLMEQLGFSSVDDVSGGIVAWESAGLPVTSG